MSQGELTQTSKDFDLAIRGEGFQNSFADGRTATRATGLSARCSRPAGDIFRNLVQPGITIRKFHGGPSTLRDKCS